RQRPRVLVADDPAVRVLAGDLAALEVERVAVAVAGGIAEDGDLAVLVRAPELDVVRDVAPDEVAPDAAPGRPLGPRHAGVEALDGRVADLVLGEPGIEGHYVGVGVADRRRAAPG